MNNNVQHVTVEATSKKHKLHTLIASCMFFVSLGLFCLPMVFAFSQTSDQSGSLLGLACLVGLCGWLASAVWLTVIKIQVWWNHG